MKILSKVLSTNRILNNYEGIINKLLVSQFTPVKPSSHSHVYALIPSIHCAPFKHGVETHSSMSINSSMSIKNTYKFQNN